MLYHLCYWLMSGNLNYAYGSPWFRAIMAILLSFATVWLFGPIVIRRLVQLKIGDRAKFDHAALDQLMKSKENTPTMGGVLIVAALLVSTLLLADLTNFYVWLALFGVVWLALLGGVDDWLKLTARWRGGTRDGLKMWEKLVFQIALGAILALFVLRAGERNLQAEWYNPEAPNVRSYDLLNIPFYKEPLALSSVAFAVIAVLVITWTSNAVNLTDGMDGLASGCMVSTALSFMVLALVIGDYDLAQKLQFNGIPEAGELGVLCGAVVGACLGFLWYNCYPAQVFMGDTGSLPLGGLMGYVAVVTRLEPWLLIVGGVFVIEGVSVLLQIFHYKLTGRRIFRCAPIHHHFHLGGLTETQVVMRFWLLAALFATFAVATLKLR